MQDPLSLNTLIVKEHLGLLKASNHYDIFDPESGAKVMECREEGLGMVSKLMRFTDLKTLTPFNIHVYEPGGKTIVRVKRGFTFIASKVHVYDGSNREIGQMQQKLLSLGGKFRVTDPNGNELFMLQGEWTGWEYKLTTGQQVLAQVTKKWAGLGKELLTTADNYVITISPDVPHNDPLRRLIIASVMCIDMVLKEY